jgi:hypothetical protein
LACHDLKLLKLFFTPHIWFIPAEPSPDALRNGQERFVDVCLQAVDFQLVIRASNDVDQRRRKVKMWPSRSSERLLADTY